MTKPNFTDKTIWTGDNLEILRGMNAECVDLIYLDPPFNSNKNYSAPIGSKAAGAAFKDTWTLSDLDVAWMGLIADEQPATAHVLRTAGITHGKGMQSYLTMMAVRLMEMRRVLKPTGSIYLHCDPTASHYLKLLMDAVLGAGAFRNEIAWQRYSSHNDAKRFGRISDRLLYYASTGATWNPQYQPLSEESVAKSYRYQDERGRFTTSPLQARSLSGGGYEGVWQGIHDVWKFSPSRLDELDADGRIYWPPKGSIPRRKVYLDDAKGKPMSDMVLDIRIANGKERTGYPTQKPLALLERIIQASSNPGDVVLDPFCGCATACIAADQLGRQWVGIDISPKAVELVNSRLQQTMGSLFHHGYVTARTDIPRRTDIDAPIHYRKNKHVLFGQQEGVCAGCRMDLPYKILEVDHMVPRSRGGGDHMENLQLLCPSCNRIKGDRPQEFLMAQLKDRTPSYA